MTYRELFDGAVRMVAEGGADGDVTDYEERAAYLLATICHQCEPLDRVYRNATGEDTSSLEIEVCVSMEDAFPLSNAFAPAVTYYLAAMLVLDENEDMSDTLFSHYANALASIRDSLPAATEKILNRYEGAL